MKETSEDHPQVDLPPPLYTFIALGAAYFLDKYWPWAIEFPGHGVAGLASLLMALALMGWALLLFRREQTTLLPHKANQRLIETGPFRFSRNPIYLAFLLLHLAVALAMANGWMLALLPVNWACLRFAVVAKEEAYLERTYGERYRDYCRRVRRWL